ncbi:MAG: Rrf2 family transcriptional regulator [Oligoflexia bacterium]|nr:Rrf2 family transcriptional regulator [Oligoflexia bacterium]
MKITFKGDYALKAILHLSLNYNRKLLTGNDLAKLIDAPSKFLEQILVDLKKGGFIESRRGNAGGYLLSKDPSLITLGEVLRHIEGPTEPISCIKDDYTNCVHIDSCVFRPVWQRVDKAASDIIDNITFAGLAKQAVKGGLNP